MYDQFDVTLEDRELLVEVELTTNLIIAASESDRKLSQLEIDRILGVDPTDGPIPPAPSFPVSLDDGFLAPPTPRTR